MDCGHNVRTKAEWLRIGPSTIILSHFAGHDVKCYTKRSCDDDEDGDARDGREEKKYIIIGSLLPTAESNIMAFV